MEEKINKLGEACFWIAFVTELIVVIIDKSAYVNPYESWIFRITFLLFAVKAVTTKYNRREIFIVIVCGLIAVISYFVNTKDEVVRAVMFVVACKDIDLRKMLKTALAITGIGALILFILSATGVFGALTVTADFGRGTNASPIVETRYCFGMGHPNAFQTMMFMLTSLVLYLYSDKMKIYHFILMEIINVIAYIFTDSKTGMLVVTAMIVGVAVMKYCKRLENNKLIYILGAIVVISAVAFSMYGAYVGNGEEGQFIYRLDKILNGRFQYAHYVYDAHIENWKLFAQAGNEEFFDQGFIRLFYWYGIIPGILYIVANIYLIWQAYTNRNYPLMVIVVSYSVLSLVEAHLISVYLLRNYLLIWLGYYWYRAYPKNKANEEYIWRLKGILKGKANEVS
jgi:hypothetical protein